MVKKVVQCNNLKGIRCITYLFNLLGGVFLKKQVYIQVYRILAMFSIVICHICEESSISIISKLGQVFNVGVFCFLFISGFLHYGKTVNNYFSWVIKKCKKIIIPMYLFLIFLFTVNIINNDFSLLSIPIYFFNLQYYLGYTTGGGHLWFLTVIMICYIFFPLFQKIEKKISIFYILILILVLGTISSYLSSKIGLTIMCLFSFFVGYAIKKYEKKINITIAGSLGLILFSILFRATTIYYFDDTPIYNIVFFTISHLLLGIGTFFLIKNLFENLKENAIINHLDSLSMYIYIVHNPFISKPFELIKRSDNFIFGIALCLAFTYFGALLLRKIENKFLSIKEEVIKK